MGLHEDVAREVFGWKMKRVRYIRGYRNPKNRKERKRVKDLKWEMIPIYQTRFVRDEVPYLDYGLGDDGRYSIRQDLIPQFSCRVDDGMSVIRELGKKGLNVAVVFNPPGEDQCVSVGFPGGDCLGYAKDPDYGVALCKAALQAVRALKKKRRK